MKSDNKPGKIIEPQVAQVDIGELLSAKRHQLKQSIADVAASTKLSKSIIQKLEDNHFESVGTAVYVRGYLGIYAKHLGLDSAEIIEQYNQQYPTEDIVIRPSAGHAFGERRQQTKQHSKTLSFIVAGLVFAGLIYAYMQIEPKLIKVAKDDDNAIDNQTTGQVVTGEADDGLSSVIGEVTAAQNLADDALNGVPIDSSKSLVSDIELDLAISPAVPIVIGILATFLSHLCGGEG